MMSTCGPPTSFNTLLHPHCNTLLTLHTAVVADDVVLFKGDEYLWAANPHLELFFKSYLQQAPVMEWCRGMRPDLVEGTAAG